MIHTVKGFGVVSKAKVDVFLELSCFFDDPEDVGNLISGSSAFSFYFFLIFLKILFYFYPLPFLNPAGTSESSWLTYCWNLAWRIFIVNAGDFRFNIFPSAFCPFPWNSHAVSIPWAFGFTLKTSQVPSPILLRMCERMQVPQGLGLHPTAT